VNAFWKSWKIKRALESIDRQPLVMRELHEGLRRKSTLSLRKGFGGGSFALLIWIFLVWPAEDAGHKAFVIFSWLTFAACILAGVFLSGDTLSKERREGTLPFLFLSSLSSGEVVLGKFAATTLVPAFTLLGILPTFMICLIVGGVTGSEVFRMMLAIPVTLLWAMALALLTSTYCSDQRIALGSALFSIIAVLLTGPAIGAILGGPASGWTAFIFCSLSPWTLVFNADAAFYVSNSWLYWSSLLITLAATYGCLALATVQISKSWRRTFSEKSSVEKNDECAIRSTDRRKFTPSNAIAWLVSRYQVKPLIPILFCIAGLIIWIGAAQIPNPPSFQRVPQPNASGGWTMQKRLLSPVAKLQKQIIPLIALQLLHIAFKIWVASAATQVFVADRRSGALEMLLGSPLSSQEIALGVLNGLRKRFRLVVLFILATDLLFAISSFSKHEFLLGAGTIMLAILLCVDIYALIWVGLIEGLLGRVPFWTLSMTLWRILGIPSIICGALPAIFFSRSLPVGLAIWFPLTLASTLWAIRSVKQQYLPHFRPIALQFFGNTLPAIESPWSFMNWEEESDGSPEPVTIRV
jgi:ABC-type transport system involved in multi-copper enzyme maturation permease subunit